MRRVPLRPGIVPAAIVLAGAMVAGTLFASLTISSRAEGSTTPAAAATASPDRAALDQFSRAFETAAERVDPSVVAIFTEADAQVGDLVGGMPFDVPPGLRRFFPFPSPAPDGGAVRRGLGSGVIVRPDGYILTNNHVVDGATKLVVRLNDDRELPATVVGVDPPSDLAVVRVDATDLPAATLGESSNLKVGTWVIAVGNPLEMLHTVTAGIVSATGRSSVGLSVYEDFIQTDASINPGNSGGALADLDGRVVGINTAIASPSGGNVGIGFAIPIEHARRVMDALIADGRVVRGYLAMIPQDVDASLAKALDLESTHGALVADVSSDGPADRAGLKPGDVVVSYDGSVVTDAAALRNAVANDRPGHEAKLGILRDGRRKELNVKLGERPDNPTIASAGGGPGEGPGHDSRGRLGLGVETLTPELARRLGVEPGPGVVVAQVVPGSPAARAGVRQGDVIADVGTHAVENANEFVERVRGASPGDEIALRVRRGEATFYVTVEVPTA